MTQSEFRKITGEVAIDILEQPAFTAFTCLSVQRAKKAERKLLIDNYCIGTNKLQPKVVIIINELIISKPDN